jgi:hypothetical protein
LTRYSKLSNENGVKQVNMSGTYYEGPRPSQPTKQIAWKPGHVAVNKKPPDTPKQYAAYYAEIGHAAI